MKEGRIFTGARVVALVFVVMLVSGLVDIRAAMTDDTLSVPDGAKAGDLLLHSCTYETEEGNEPADCGVLVVAENRTDPDSRLIALPVVRVRARSGSSAEPIFRLEGGPGITNMDFWQASRYVDHRDLVLVGYRGVDGSTRLDCPEVSSALAKGSDMLSEQSFLAYADAFRDCAARFAEDGVDVSSYGLVQQVDDMEAARVALGYDKINLLSESAGTRTAQIYAWRYPDSVHRSVMVGVNPPGHFLWDPEATDEQIERYSEYCSKDPECSARTDDLAEGMREVTAGMPDRWMLLPMEGNNARVLTFFGLMESASEAAPLNAPTTIDSWLSAAEGDPSGLWLQSVVTDMYQMPFVWGQYAAAGSIDAQAAREYFSRPDIDRDRNFGYAGSAFVWGDGRLADAWPVASGVDEYRKTRVTDVETLLIGGELDFTTPPQIASKEVLPYLTNGKEVVLPGFAHTLTIWKEQPEAGTRLINTYFDSGEVDDSLYQPGKVDFTPDVPLPLAAKGFAAIMVGLAAVTVLWLAWLGIRLGAKGGTGRKAGAWIRSLSPVVFGLGGWFLGVLFSMTLWPSLSVTAQFFVAVSVGVPIWIGAYAGWANPHTTAEVRPKAILASGVGALVGAWLGFHAADGFLSLITSIMGAAAGTNLALLVLDIWTAARASDGVPPRVDTVVVSAPAERRDPAMR